MSLYTNFLKLLKPDESDKYNINVFNDNADLIDSEFSRLEQKNQSQDNLLATKESLNAHINNKNNPHEVTKSQIGLGNVENKSSATIRGEITKSNVTTALGYTPYTPNEVDNKLSALETKIDWKESVETLDDIFTTYPNPQDGWTVNTKDTDYTYRFNGDEWVVISANAIPKATNSIDGLLSKEDHTKYDDANSKKHTHSNKSVLDEITSALISSWNNAVTHISDHIKHITSDERTLWNTVSDKVDKINGKGLSANDYTDDEKEKLAGISDGAGVNVQSDFNVSDANSDAYIKNKPVTNDLTPTYTEAKSLVTLTSGEKLSIAFGKISKAITELISHIGNNDNPHNVTKTQVGLGNVENKDSATIISEISKEDIIATLGYTPLSENTDTWQENTKDNEGYVAAGKGHESKIWGTDEEGNPQWINNAPSADKLSTPCKINGVLFDGTKDITITTDKNNEFLLINQEVLIFDNDDMTCTITDERITENSLADVYFTSDTIDIAENAVISVETYDKNIKLNCQNMPTGTIKASIIIKVV